MMRRIVLLQLLLIVNYIQTEALSNNLTDPASSRNTFSLDLDDKYRLFWSVSEEYVTFEVQVQTRGWIGFGLSDEGRMAGADIVIGGVRQGRAYFKDYHGIGNVQPQIDQVQSYDLLHYQEVDGVTTLKFGRKKNTCDRQDYKIKHDTARVLFAYGDDDPDGDDVTYHGPIMRGSESVLLLDDTTKTDVDQDDLMTFDLNFNAVSLPRRPSYYHCGLFKIPPLKRKHHIVKIAQLIQKGHRKFIHHVAVLACPPSTKLDKYLAAGFECHDNDAILELCNNYVYSVAAGAMPLHFPEEAGIPFGEKGGPQYYKMEVHYNNIQMLDIVDNYGVRMYYTDVLRPHDMGTFVLHADTNFPPFVIPPNISEYHVDTILGQRWTEQLLPEDGINIIVALLHMHKHGAAMHIKHIRNGEELPEIAGDDYFDYRHQLMRSITPRRKVLPGDELIARCTYNTLGRTDPVLAGWTTQQEMCFTLLHYYPRIKYHGCISRSNYFQPVRDLVKRKVKSGQIKQHGFNIDLFSSDTKDEDFYFMLMTLNWNAEDVRYLQAGAEGNNTYKQSCHVGGTEYLFDLEWSLEQKAVINKPLVDNLGDMCPARFVMVNEGSREQVLSKIITFVLVVVNILIIC